MPRKNKITAVPIEQKEEGITCGDDEAKTDAQHRTDIINEVNAPDLTYSVEEAPAIEDQEEVPVAKPKAKRASRSKISVVTGPTEQVVEPVLTLQVSDQREVEVTASLDEVEAVVRIPSSDELKMDTKVACPDCGKQMSAKTLKYSHGPNCSSKKQKQSPREQIDKSVFEEVVESEVQKRLHNTRACRAIRRQEMVEKLMQNAF